MSKNFKSFIISCLISISTIGVMGTTSFADDIEGTERFIPIGEEKSVCLQKRKKNKWDFK